MLAHDAIGSSMMHWVRPRISKCRYVTMGCGMPPMMSPTRAHSKPGGELCSRHAVNLLVTQRHQA
ncbi:hypothetical protein BIFGAL_04357 [Bifidobacterium gallicum DSM 20093 = LMG 11596]|uniref:Uncharacterized protein n=1 Tax=Bifidobacterium gallicum DSM 20093 = LMG 11596 TaxID=561180 RepID=D1NWV1_9BIFI|nr:hypothetical protein BIFGAL_04357 [Bifidobacterium gallicum DSM 20093 = LMG 11596]